MATILFKCKGCSKHLAIDEVAKGKTVKCVGCGQPVQVPQSATAFRCPACTCAVSAQSSLAGEVFRCPNCKGRLDVPENQERKQPSAQSAPSSRPRGTPSSAGGGARRCPACANVISDDGVICVNCGLDLRTGRKVAERPPTAHKEAARGAEAVEQSGVSAFGKLRGLFTRPAEKRRAAAAERKETTDRALENAYDAILAGIESGMLARPHEVNKLLGCKVHNPGTMGLGESVLSAALAWRSSAVDSALINRIANDLILHIGMYGSQDHFHGLWHNLPDDPTLPDDSPMNEEEAKNKADAEKAASNIAVWAEPKTIVFGSIIMWMLKQAFEHFDAEENGAMTQDDYQSIFDKTYGMFAERVTRAIASSRTTS